MAQYTVNVYETWVTQVTIEADTEEEVYTKAMDMYHDGVICPSDDLIDDVDYQIVEVTQ